MIIKPMKKHSKALQELREIEKGKFYSMDEAEKMCIEKWDVDMLDADLNEIERKSKFHSIDDVFK